MAGNAAVAGAVAVDRDAVHEPALAGVVVERVVIGTAVVPEGDVVGAPAPAAGELRSGGVGETEVWQRGSI